MEFIDDPKYWVYLAFFIFLGLAWKPVSRALGKALDARASRIKAELDEARNLREETQRLLADHQRKQREVVKEAEAIIAHARGEADRLRQEASANLEATILRREKMAMDKIAQAEAQAVADVRNHAIDIAIAAAGKLLNEAVDARKGDELVQAAIAELDRKLY
ncbi:MAG: F0F1 ATP synthase subunit B [Dongiaceae bacterium]